jgi:hypothetical protein
MSHRRNRHMGLEATNYSGDPSYFHSFVCWPTVDLLLVRGRRRWGFEVKRTSAPIIMPSMRIALTDLKLQHLFVVHAGKYSFDMTKKIRAIAVLTWTPR